MQFLFYIGLLIFIALPFTFGLRAALYAGNPARKAGAMPKNLFGAGASLGLIFALGMGLNSMLNASGCTGGTELQNCATPLAEGLFALEWAAILALPVGALIAGIFTLIAFITIIITELRNR